MYYWLDVGCIFGLFVGLCYGSECGCIVLFWN